MENETEAQGIVELFFSFLEQLLLPNWSDLIALVPWVLMVLVVLFVAHTAYQWRRAGERTRPRVAPRLASGAPPPGVHLPGPSRWPFVLPIGAALLLFAFALPTRDESGALVSPFNVPLLIGGLAVTAIAVVGWLLDAMREWRATAHAPETAHEPIGPGTHGAPVMATSAVPPTTSSAVASTALATRPAGAAQPIAEIPVEPVREPPPGVHMPGPSPWPFFAPIGLTLMFFGLIFSAVLIVGGLILALISAVGWYVEASREYRTTEEVGHPVPATRDPVRAWPRRLVPVFAAVIVISVLITLAPFGIAWLNSLTPAEAGPTPVAVPAVPEITASNAISFETDELIVPCCRPFELVFHNNDPNVPHNVELTVTSAREEVLFDGEVIDGVETITYEVDAIDEGEYYFLCAIHPNMNGTLLVRPESDDVPQGPPVPGPADGPGASPPAEQPH